MQVFIDKSKNGGKRAIIKCSAERCEWLVCIACSQSKLHHNKWSVNYSVSNLQHTCIGQPPENLKNCKGRASYLLEHPDVQNILRGNYKISARHLSQAVNAALGIHLPRVTSRELLLLHRRSVQDLAEKDLVGIGRLCQAFMECNPGTDINLEVDANGAFHRFLVCPGIHDSFSLVSYPYHFQMVIILGIRSSSIRFLVIWL
jgi:hypothetical protein